MKTLVIFDQHLTSDQVASLSLHTEDTVYLFPLTAKITHVRMIEGMIGNNVSRVEIIQTARLVNAAAERIRDVYIKFIAALPHRIHCWGNNLKEYFAIDQYATLWWFSLIAEKNTLKTDSFHRLAQLDAIVEAVRKEGIERVVYGCSSGKLEKALKKYAEREHLPMQSLRVKANKGIRKKFSELHTLFYVKHLLLLLYFAAYYSLRKMRIRKKFGDLERLKRNENDLTIISYYPYIDMPLAKQGVFQNRYFNHLQEAIESPGRKITWVLLSVHNNAVTFKESLDYAARCSQEGYDICFVEEFISVLAQLRNLLRMIISGFKFVIAEKDIAGLHTFGDYNFYEVFRDDWYASFSGYVGYLGLMYYDAYKSMLNRTGTQKCLYYCEMHAWEKALISARNKEGGRAALFGYQHACVSKMELFYFNDKEEIHGSDRYRLPRPDRIICNGNRPYTYLAGCGWESDRLAIAEAIRFNHLKQTLQSHRGEKGDIVVIGLSINPEGSSALLSLAYEAMRELDEIEVWIKPHPFLKLEKALALSGISQDDLRATVRYEPIEQLLADAKILVVAESSIAVEALALGCTVINVNNAEFIDISPLRGIETPLVSTVSSAEELQQAIMGTINGLYDNKGHSEEAERIINDFFYLNRKTDVPEKFMSLLYSQISSSEL